MKTLQLRSSSPIFDSIEIVHHNSCGQQLLLTGKSSAGQIQKNIPTDSIRFRRIPAGSYWSLLVGWFEYFQFDPTTILIEYYLGSLHHVKKVHFQLEAPCQDRNQTGSFFLSKPNCG